MESFAPRHQTTRTPKGGLYPWSQIPFCFCHCFMWRSALFDAQFLRKCVDSTMKLDQKSKVKSRRSRRRLPSYRHRLCSRHRCARRLSFLPIGRRCLYLCPRLCLRRYPRLCLRLWVVLVSAVEECPAYTETCTQYHETRPKVKSQKSKKVRWHHQANRRPKGGPNHKPPGGRNECFFFSFRISEFHLRSR
jgi:hypothetical protein